MAGVSTRGDVPPSAPRRQQATRRYGGPLALTMAWLLLTALIAWQPGVAGYDATYALAWSRDLFHRSELVLPSGAPTPHPAGLLLSWPLSTGSAEHGRAILLLWSAAAYAAAVVAFAGLAGSAAKTRSHLAAVGVGCLTAVILLGSPELMLVAKIATPDVWFVLLVCAGAWVFATGRPLVGVVLVLAAALQRPEGWLIALALVLLGCRRDVRAWVALTVPPLAWLGMGVLFGNPMVGLNASQDNATALDRDTGLRAAIESIPSAMSSGIGWAAASTSLVVTLFWVAVRIRGHGPRPASDRALDVLVLILLVDLGAYVATGITGAALLPRYLVLAQFAAAALAAVGIARAAGYAVQHPNNRWTLTSAVGAAAAVIATAATVATGTSDYPELRHLMASQDQLDGPARDLGAELAARAASCGPIYTVVSAQIPVFAIATVRPLGEVRPVPTVEPDAGTVIYPKTAGAFEGRGFGPRQPVVADIPIPAGFEKIAENNQWAAYARC